MPELGKPDLEQLITELLVALRPKCCRLVQCPDLSADPAFGLKIPALGQLIYIVPDTISLEEAAKQIERGQILATKNNFHIVSDGRQGQVLHLSLSNCPSTCWRQSIRSVLNRLLADQWEMIFVEKLLDQNGRSQIGLLRASQEGEGGLLEGDDGPREVWMAPVNRRIVAGCVKKVKKKIIRKVLRKSSKEEEIVNGTICNGKTLTNGEDAKLASTTTTSMDGGELAKGKGGGESLLQNGHSGRTPPASPKQNGRGEGIVGRIANIFNGMGGAGNNTSNNNNNNNNNNNMTNGRAGRGRSQSLEEPTENGKSTIIEKLKRSDSEGGATSSESTTATMTEKTIKQNGNIEGGTKEGEKLQPIQKQDSFSGPFVRIPVQMNGASPSPEREKPAPEAKLPQSQQNGGVPMRNGGNGPTMVNGQMPGAKTTKPENKTTILANGGPNHVPLALAKPLSLSVASNRPISSAESSPPKDSPPSSPISPPSASAGSDSPNSFHSATGGESPLVVAAGLRRSRREDAPSPSTSLIQNVANNNGTTSRRNGGGPGGPMAPASRLGPPFGSLLSPISSCGSVEAQKDLEDADEHGSEEEESTLMLLNRTSAGRSTMGCEDPDELSCSLRDDFSMASISQKGTVGGTFSSSAAVAAAIRQHQLNQQEIGGAGGSRPSGAISGSSRRVQSPSPPSKQAVSQSPAPPMVRGMLGNFRMPVPVLQQVIGLFSYKEMGELRRVHPHWDELCGQLLNAAHSHLLHQAQCLLTECQRRLHREPRMAQPVQLLTRLHVHVLNPVDGMRAFMDEGVLCFPYGALLDGAYAMLDRIQAMIANSDIDTNKAREREYDDASLQMDQVGEMARRAALHYRQWVEPEAEKRMSELYRASAQQRLQRLDSFLVESNVSRVERESEKARSDLGWEMEQLRQQNQQLRKENRELKQLCQRLDQRVDVLERKFKTMARLLQ